MAATDRQVRRTAPAEQVSEPPPVLCLRCAQPLPVRFEAADGPVTCESCGATYPLRDGVLRILPGLGADERQVRAAFDFEHARYRDSARCRLEPERIDELLQELAIEPAALAGATVLDAGCGSGRWSYALAALGAQVTAVDFTDAGVRATRQAVRQFPGCRVIQASVETLPFPAGSFDLVLCWGVLHHTRDTRASFEAVARQVRPGGLLHVMVYERVGWRRRTGTTVLRALLRQLPPRWRYRACRLLVIPNDRVYRWLAPWVKVYSTAELQPGEDRQTLVFDAYDAYSPRFNHQHTWQEVMAWFRAAGFHPVRLTRPIRFTRPQDVARFGACGGSVNAQGVRMGSDPIPAARWALAPARAAIAELPDARAHAARGRAGDTGGQPIRRLRHGWAGYTFMAPRDWSTRRRGAAWHLRSHPQVPGAEVAIVAIPLRAALAGSQSLPRAVGAIEVTDQRLPEDDPLTQASATAWHEWLPEDQRAEPIATTRTRRTDGTPVLRERYLVSWQGWQRPVDRWCLLLSDALFVVTALPRWDPAAKEVRRAEAVAGTVVETLRRVPATWHGWIWSAWTTARAWRAYRPRERLG